MTVPIIVFATMVLAFLVATVKLSWPSGLAMGLAAVLGMAIGQGQVEVAPLVEGAFGFFDVGLVIATAMMFMKALELAGTLEDLTARLLGGLGSRRGLILAACTFLVMLPGMLTGSSTAAALTTGRFVIPVLLGLGMAQENAATFVALASIFGMTAPPVNIPAMIIGSGVDMPYVGFEVPLLLISLPLALGLVIWSWTRLRRTPGSDRVALEGAGSAGPTSVRPGWLSDLRVAAPFVVVIGPMVAIRVWPGVAPDIGLAAIFALGTLSVWALTPRLNMITVVRQSLDLSMPILGILAGAGMFVTVMTMTGARGLLVSSALLLSARYLLIVGALVIPLFGGVSAYASASVLGVPFLLAMLGKSDIATAAAISALAAVGDLMPPIALVPSLSVQAFGSEGPGRARVIKRCLVGGAAIVVVAASLAYFAKFVGFLSR
ncbi:MAG: TRAP transporter large permease subunit [Bacillota bacterium]